MRGFSRRVAVGAITILVALTSPAGVLAAAPTNDTYKNAIAITSLPYSQAIDLTEATDDPGLPACQGAAHRRIWYTFTPPTNEVIRISIGGDDFNRETAELALWKVVNGGPKGLALAQCTVQGRDLGAPVAAGSKYAISVGQYVDAPPLIEPFEVRVQDPPTNDDFDAAELVSDNNFSSFVDPIAALAATIEASEPTPNCLTTEPFAASVWYRLVLPARSRVSIGAEATRAVYTGVSLSSLSPVKCAQAEFNLSFDASADTAYYVQVLLPNGGAIGITSNVTPANDDFADAIEIVDMPAQFSLDETGATVESGEPTPSCADDFQQTVWWSFTPPSDGFVTGNAYTWVGLYTGSSLGQLSEIGCAMYFQNLSVAVTAGTKVYIQLGNGGNSASLFLQYTPTPSNDAFADAVAVTTGSAEPANLAGASTETGEPIGSCSQTPGRSTWYSFVGDGSSTSLSLDPGSYGFSVVAYTGSSLDSLSEIGCRYFDGRPLTIRPAAGQVVHIQLWSWDYCCTQATTLHVDVAPQPTAAFGISITDPSIFDDISFVDQTSDPGGNPVTAWHWTFGDGAGSTDQYPIHRFAADEDYSVTLAIVTSDGRTASTTQTVAVRTHDVGIAKLMVPTTAKAGQSKQITVGVGDRRYPESVSVHLLVSRGGGSWQEVGVITRDVPVLGANQTVDFQFNYVFTKADATAGKVTFRAIATLNGARDALPADNEAISVATKVTR